MIEFQRKEDYSLDCLIGNEIVTIRVNYGPGYWYRVVQCLETDRSGGAQGRRLQVRTSIQVDTSA